MGLSCQWGCKVKCSLAEARLRIINDYLEQCCIFQTKVWCLIFTRQVLAEEEEEEEQEEEE